MELDMSLSTKRTAWVSRIVFAKTTISWKRQRMNSKLTPEHRKILVDLDFYKKIIFRAERTVSGWITKHIDHDQLLMFQSDFWHLLDRSRPYLSVGGEDMADLQSDLQTAWSQVCRASDIAALIARNDHGDCNRLDLFLHANTSHVTSMASPIQYVTNVASPSISPPSL